MVDLPTVPDRIVTSTAPTSSVSRSDIIGENDRMASALGKVADATMDIATKQAKEQAANDLQNQKVALNADGSVSVLNPANSLIFGRAGEQYHAAVQAGTIAQHSNIISEQMNNLHQEFPTDPAAFKAASDSWKAKYIEQHAGGATGEAITQQVDASQTQHFNAITNMAGQNDLATQNSAITATQTSARNDVMAMLRGGAAIDDKAVQSRIAQFDSATAARAANPLFAYSKEQAQLDSDTFHSEATASRLLYHVDQVYKDKGDGGGYNGAMDAAKDILANPAYKLSETQRDSFYHRAVADIRANEAIRKQDLGEARAAFSELSMASATNQPIDSNRVELVAKAFRDSGDPGGAARVYSSFMRKPLNDDFGRQPLSVQTNQLIALQGAKAATSAQQFFLGKGYTPEQAAGIVGNLVHESGMDSGASGDGGTSGGLAQFHNERLTALKAFAAERGKPATDFTTQLEFIDRELRGGKAGINSKLADADVAMKLTPQERALYERHLSNLTGPGGVDNADGSRSTLYQATVEHDGKTYSIPTVWDGKILSASEAVKRVQAEGWEKFPAYKSPQEAEARYQQMHTFMDQDTGQYQQPGSEAVTYRKLQGARTPEEAAHAFIGYERPKGWTPENPAGGLGYESRKALARTVFDGRPPVTDKSMGPAGSAWLAANRAATIDDAATKQWQGVVKEYAAEGTRPSVQIVNDVIKAARATNNADLLEQIAHDSQRMDLARDFGRAPMAAQGAAITSLKASGAAGDLAPGWAATEKDFVRRNAAITKGLEENPIATTVQNFPDKMKPPGPIDFSTAGALAGSLANRAAIAQFGALNWETPPLAVLDQADIKQVQAALQSPQGATVLTTMASVLRPAELHKLLEQKEFKDSVVGMQASLDEGKMTAANSVADAMWHGNAALAESVLGPKSIERLHTWQAQKDTFTGAELAKTLNRADDPALAQARKDALDAAEKETSKLSVGDMAYKLGTGSWLLGGITGNTPKVPYDSLQGSALLNDYKAAYAQLRANGVPAEAAESQAVERQKSTWGTSQAAGNRLMKLPPEKYYPAIDGTTNWIDDQLNGWITKQVGPAVIPHQDQPRATAGTPRYRWSLAGLVSDRQTESEVNSRQPPSYQVAIMHDGALEIMPKRVTFDPANPLRDMESGLRSKYQNIQTARANQLSLGAALP